MRFAVLGPVRAWRQEVELGLGSPQQRAVLVALLLKRGRPATVGELISGVWGERPPPGALSVLRTYISRLRKVLEPERQAGRPERLLVSVADGYAVHIGEDALDLGVFERRVSEAKRARAEDELARAAELLRGGLGCWEGVPLAGIAGPLADAERSRLEEQRLSALEMRLEVELNLGRHDEAVTELAALTREFPLRERLCELLMLALYRCGRQAEALAVYRRTQRTLETELGLGPGPSLLELHSRLLAADPALAAPVRDGQPGTASAAHRDEQAMSFVPAVRPSQLPAAIPAFSGRVDELAYARATGAQLRSRTPVVVSVSGMPGVGKTAFAVRWAHQLAPQYPDGQLYVNLRAFEPSGSGFRSGAGSALDPGEALRGFLEALGVPARRMPTGLDARSAQYRSLLADRRVLILLDNARDSEQIRPLLPGTPGCLVIATSRGQLAGLIVSEGAQPMTLEPLSHAESVEFLSRRLGARRTTAEPNAVDEIVMLCGRLPLALASAAARAATNPAFPLSALAAELRGSHGTLDAFPEVRDAFSRSYDSLSPAAARLFRLLSLHPGPDISAPAAMSLAGLPGRQTRELLADLTRAQLLTEHVPGRYSFHELLRAYATELAAALGAGERQVAVQRMLDHYLHTAHRAVLLLDPHREGISLPPPRPGAVPEEPAGRMQAEAWLGIEHAVLLSAVARAADAGFDEYAWGLAWALEVFLAEENRREEEDAVRHGAPAAGEGPDDRCAQGHVPRIPGCAVGRPGRFGKARDHLREALREFTALREAAVLGRTHRGPAFQGGQQGPHQRALEHLQRARRCFAAGDQAEEAPVCQESAESSRAKARPRCPEGESLVHSGDSAGDG